MAMNTERIDGCDLCVLVFAPIGRDAPVTVELLRSKGLTARACPSLADLRARFDEGVGAVCVAEEGLFGKDTAPLSAWIEQQPAWSDLPFIVLTSRHDAPVVRRWREQLREVLQNVTFLERPLNPISLTSAVSSAMRARAQQYEMRFLLLAKEGAAAELERQVQARTRELGEVNAELKRQMVERAHLEESRRQAQKIEAIGQLTGGIAHDFNNLLMVISGGLSLLQSIKGDPGRRDQILEGMRHAADRGSALTGQLLAFARKKSLKAESVDLVRHVTAMRDLLQRSLGGDIEVELRFPEGLWPVKADPAELELVLLNLCVNSRDAMPSGGTIVIEARNEPALRTHRLNGDFVRLAVTDTGTGMTDEVKKKVFEPFFTTKEIGKGSGLGLPQVLGFAEQSGGSVEIETAPERGTTIALLLPKSRDAVLESEAPRAPENHEPSRRTNVAGTVLLVEDDDEVATLVGEMLDVLGWRVERTATAAAALDLLDRDRPMDLVFSDVMMPGAMSGLDLAKEIQRRRPRLPILLTTGFAGGVAEAARVRNLKVLAKPYRLDELEKALLEVLA
jgi:signal transduction histidine kinase/CheY-like chemotaxis protein